MGSFQGTLHKGRLEALSDGVFAVVLTLLVLDLKLDHLPAHASNAEVKDALREALHPLIGYAFSFAITAAFWLLQHRKFSFLTHTTVRHTVWTLAFLFGISLIPFSVSIYLRSMQSGVASCAYFGNFTFIAAVLLGGWLDAQRSKLIASTATKATRDRFTQRLAGMTLAMAIGSVVAYFQPGYAGAALALVIVTIGRLTKTPPLARQAHASS